MAYIPNAYDFISADELEQRERSRELIKSVLAQREQHDRELAMTALHEAGHATLMQYFFGDDAVLSVAIKPTGAGETIPAKHPKASYPVLASIYAGGAAAETKLLGRVPDVCATDSYLDDLAAFDDIRKFWRKPGSVTVAFIEAAEAVKEEIFDREPDVWAKTLATARRILEAPGGRLVFQPELAAAIEQDRRVKQYIRHQRRPKTSKSFQRLMHDADAFWKREGYL